METHWISNFLQSFLKTNGVLGVIEYKEPLCMAEILFIAIVLKKIANSICGAPKAVPSTAGVHGHRTCCVQEGALPSDF